MESLSVMTRVMNNTAQRLVSTIGRELLLSERVIYSILTMRVCTLYMSARTTQLVLYSFTLLNKGVNIPSPLTPVDDNPYPCR